MANGNPAAVRLSSALRKKVHDRTTEDGVGATATAIGISREALSRAIAGLPVRAGTVAMIEKAVGV